MTLYAFFKEFAQALDRWAENSLKPEDSIGEALSKANNVDDYYREQYHLYCLAQQVQHKIPKRSRYRGLIDRFLKDQELKVHEFIQLRRYLHRNFA